METAVHSGRREERVPLDALIELRSDESAEVLEADGFDLSPGGLAMRAAFVPPVGAKLKCQFRCSPEGERVRAEGEVVWSQWESDRDGAFGMRFLELDTKSATAIRRHMEPELEPSAEAEPELPRVANMRIDGVGAPIEADVLFADGGSIVIEQELNFLKLGRGVSIDVPGRGPRRGRIASVELRHGPLDVPALVFGILWDNEAEVREVAAEVQPAPRLSEQAPMASAPVPAFHAATPSVPPKAFVQVAGETVAAKLAAPGIAPVSSAAVDPDIVDNPFATPSLLAQVSGLYKAFAAWLALLWSRVVPTFKAVTGSFQGQTAQLREAHWPEAKSKLAVHFARARLLVSAQKARFGQLRKQREAKPRATTTAPRVQRSSAATPRTAEAPRKAPKGNGSRWLAIGLAVVGIALGVYALAPRSGADRIRVRHSSLESAVPATSTEVVQPAREASSALTVEPPALEAREPAPQQGSASTAVDPPLGAGQPTALTFGEASVPNGRTFSLRMSGPVEGVEGESREDGFTVRVPGRLALDRASPIATSHRAVARAMVLNRGDYAELTVDFLPGLRPKYQVVGKDAAIEVTLERL